MNNSIFKLQTFVETTFSINTHHSKFKNTIHELIVFGYKNAISCIFPVLIFTLLALSKVLPLGPLPRYDFLLLACIGIQLFMMVSKLESKDELLVICLFHIMGLLMEWFKVHRGSWSYPEDAFSKVFNVPLYSGFMYASVASFMCQAWRRFDLEFVNWPNNSIAWVLAISVYLNFFTQHYIGDYRYYIGFVILVVFIRAKVYFTTNNIRRNIPVILSFILIGFFIWLAENISTFFGAWKYTNQHNGWKLVHYQKIGSWILMSIVSYIIVAQLKKVKEKVH